MKLRYAAIHQRTAELEVTALSDAQIEKSTKAVDNITGRPAIHNTLSCVTGLRTKMHAVKRTAVAWSPRYRKINAARSALIPCNAVLTRWYSNGLRPLIAPSTA